jgi:hypothetical protein
LQKLDRPYRPQLSNAPSYTIDGVCAFGTASPPTSFPAEPRSAEMTKYRKGTKVEWKWGSGTAKGKVAESFTEDVERTIKGETIKRKATKKEPAYLVEQDDGGRALKSHSELKKVT